MKYVPGPRQAKAEIPKAIYHPSTLDHSPETLLRLAEVCRKASHRVDAFDELQDAANALTDWAALRGGHTLKDRDGVEYPRDTNLSAWIERRAADIGPYADHILKSVKEYEAEIAKLRNARESALRQAYQIAIDMHDPYSDCDGSEFVAEAINDLIVKDKLYNAPLGTVAPGRFGNGIKVLGGWLHESTGNILNWLPAGWDGSLIYPSHCAECDCDNPPKGCNWIKWEGTSDEL